MARMSEETLRGGALVIDGSQIIGECFVGGTNDGGTIWDYNLQTGQMLTRLNFGQPGVDTVTGTGPAADPTAGLISYSSSDGLAFIGYTSNDGPSGNGTIFLVTPEPGSSAMALAGIVSISGLLMRMRILSRRKLGDARLTA